MFDELLINNTIEKEKYEQEVELLRQDLLKMQYALLQKDFSVIIVFTGDDRIGSTRMLNTFYEWLDARYLNSKVFQLSVKKDKSGLPYYHQFWQNLPPKGEIAFFINEWNAHYLAKKVLEKMNEKESREELEQILSFEKLLADDKTIILKFWLHIGKNKLKERIKNAKKNPGDYWWVKKNDMILYKNYDNLMLNADQFIRQTDHAQSRWHLIDSTDYNARNLQIGKIIASELKFRIENETPTPKGLLLITSKIDIHADFKTILDEVDLTQNLSLEKYKEDLSYQQKRISKCMNASHKKGISNIVLFEGWDASGKGGTIRRLIYAMDAQYYEVVQFAAPTEEEKRYNYLHRFWKNIPSKGHCHIFDRSWYGRVLVERIEGFANENEWERAFAEILNFEHQLHEAGIILHKFWLHISPDEQIRRFKKRENISYKNYKITEEDYRNREKWDYYKVAVHDLVMRTSTQNSPWHIVAADDKKFARVEVLKLIADGIESALF